MTQNTLSSSLQSGGAVVYWKAASKSSKDSICAGLSAIGLERYEPDERSATTLLNAALKNVLSDTHAVVRPLAGRAGYHIFMEIKGEKENRLEEYGKAYTHRGDSFSSFTFDGKLQDAVQDIRREFVSEAQWVTGTTVTNCLIDILKSLGGVSLREMGSVYWLPIEQRPRWETVCKVFEQSSEHAGDTMVHTLEVRFDASAVRAVTEGVSEEIGAEIKEIHARLEADGLRNGTAEKLKRRLDVLMEKAAQYEQAIGSSLTAIRQAHEQAIGTTALANLLRAVAQEQKNEVQDDE